jgi:hypothetical protein
VADSAVSSAVGMVAGSAVRSAVVGSKARKYPARGRSTSTLLHSTLLCRNLRPDNLRLPRWRTLTRSRGRHRGSVAVGSAEGLVAVGSVVHSEAGMAANSAAGLAEVGLAEERVVGSVAGSAERTAVGSVVRWEGGSAGAGSEAGSEARSEEQIRTDLGWGTMPDTPAGRTRKCKDLPQDIQHSR